MPRETIEQKELGFGGGLRRLKFKEGRSGGFPVIHIFDEPTGLQRSESENFRI